MSEFLETMKGMGTNLGSIGANDILSSPLMKGFAFFGKIAFYMIVAFTIGVAVYKLWIQYKVKVTVRKEIGGGAFEVVHDRAKIVVDKQNKLKLVLFKTRKDKKPVTAPVPEARFKTKIGKKDHYEFVIDDNGQLHPVEMDWAGVWQPELKILPQDRQAWARMEDKLIDESFRIKQGLDKYMPSIIVLSAFMIAFLIFFFMSKDLASSLNGLSGTFSQIASECASIRP